MFFNSLFYQVTPGAVSPKTCAALLEAMLASPLVSRSPLAGSFEGSHGLAFTFRREGLPFLYQQFPLLEKFLTKAIEDAPHFLPFPWRHLFRKRTPNAFYLNLLLVGANQGVGRHVDGTLRQASGLDDVLPEAVSVVYLNDTQALQGGEFRLLRGNREVACIQPKTGMLLHFRGDLEHEVTPLQSTSSSAFRASLVCELYALPPEALARLPEFRMHSKAGFEARLKNLQQNPMTLAYHLVAKEDFQEDALLYTPKRFANEGFVHTTRRREHVHEVGNRYYAYDTRPYWVLTVDLSKLQGLWRYDAPNEDYPHIYSPLPAEAILRLEEAPRSTSGTFLPLP